MEGNGVFHSHFGTLVSGVSPETGLPLDIIRYLPRQVEGTLRTVIGHAMLPLIQSVPRSRRRRSPRASPVESQRSQMGTTLQAVIEPVYIIIHTDREVQIEWREEIGINRLVITLVTIA